MSSQGLSTRLKIIRKLRPFLPTWSKMAEFSARQIADGTDRATGSWTGDRSVICVGEQSFFMKSKYVSQAPEIWDFALFGLAAISSRTNRTITFDMPVTESAAKAMAKLNYTYRLWSIPSLSPPRLELSNIVADHDILTKENRKIICLSGGVDSTSAAIAAKTEAKYTHGLLIAGADYPSADHPGFQELQTRVQSSAEIIGLELITLETDFRTMPMDWELQHGFLLAMSLHYHARTFAEGSYALDSSPEHEIIQHPWGNCAALMHLFSTSCLPIIPYCGQLHRGEKAKLIADFSHELVKNMSVCWVDVSTGSNCGKCSKCQRTKDMFESQGVSTSGLFRHDINNLTGIDLKVQKDYGVRMNLVIKFNWARSLKQGSPRRHELDINVEKLRREYVRQMPYR